IFRMHAAVCRLRFIQYATSSGFLNSQTSGKLFESKRTEIMQTMMTVETPARIADDQPPPQTSRTDHKMRCTLSAILLAQFQLLQSYHRELVERPDPDAIHKMRVTTRRAQAALDLLEGQLDIAPVKKRLRCWRRELSRVRNYDVFLTLLEKEAAAVRAGNRQPFELVRAVLQQRRADTAGKVRKYLLNKNVSRLAARIGLR